MTTSNAAIQPLGNLVTTDINNYQLQQNDGIVIAKTSLALKLCSNPIIGTPVIINAAGGNVVVSGPIQGGPVLVLQGTLRSFSFDAASGTFSSSPVPSGPVSPFIQIGEVIQAVDPTARLQAVGGTATLAGDVSLGTSCVSNGPNAFTAGFTAQASGQGACALGYMASASGIGTFAAGAGQANGITCCAFGESQALGLDSAAFGKSKAGTATTSYDFAAGQAIANGGASAAFNEATASGQASAAFNSSTANDANDFACANGVAGNGTSTGANFAACTGSQALGGGSAALAGGTVAAAATGSAAIGGCNVAVPAGYKLGTDGGALFSANADGNGTAEIDCGANQSFVLNNIATQATIGAPAIVCTLIVNGTKYALQLNALA